MKYILFFLSILILSCNSQRQTSKDEIAKFSISGDTIFYENKYCARYTELEWEYYKFKMLGIKYTMNFGYQLKN